MADVKTEYSYSTLNRSGLYLQLYVQGNSLATTGAGGVANFEFIVPLKADSFPGPTDTQSYFFPIKELFENMSTAISSMKPSLFTSGVELATKLQDLFGVRMFQESFNAQAWKNANPSSFSIKLDFNWGMKDLFDAKEEVMRPIYTLKQLTVPFKKAAGVGGNYYSPAPSAKDIYVSFGKDIINSVVDTAKDISKAVTAGAKSLIGIEGVGDGQDVGVISKSSGAITDIINNLTSGGSGYGIWSVNLISYDKSSSRQVALFNSPPLVCVDSAHSLGSQFDQNGYPITGEINLTFSSQLPATAGNYSLATLKTSNSWSLTGKSDGYGGTATTTPSEATTTGGKK